LLDSTVFGSVKKIKYIAGVYSLLLD